MSRRGENIYKRKDGRWEGRYIKCYNSDGSAKFGYCYGKTYKEVKGKLIDAKAALVLGQHFTLDRRKRRFAQYCDEWLLLYRSRVKPATYAKYISIVEKHIKPHLGGYLPDGLSSPLIEEFSYELLSEEGLAAKTVKDILMVLNSIIKYISRQYPGVLAPLEVIYPKVGKNKVRVLTKDEQAKLVEYLLADLDECKLGVLLALLTGMRIGELCALRWRDISLKAKTIQISATMQRLKNLDGGAEGKTKILISDPKSDFSIRTIPITEYTASLCARLYPEDEDAYVLTGRADQFAEPRTMQYRLERYTQECGIEDVHFHTLRHTFATRCVEVDFEIKSLSEILGHSSPNITLERYVHSSLQLKRDNMDKLSNLGF